jgi:hypothetical protein
MNPMRILYLFILVCLMSAAGYAQGAKIQLDTIDRLAGKAAETVEVSLDAQLLQVASRFLRADRQEEAAIRSLIEGLKGVYVRVLNFDRPGEYQQADIDAIRSQLRAPGWSRIVGVKSRRENQGVEVFTWLEGGRISGLTIIAAEPKELVLVNIIGLIDLEKLSQLEGKFGIPRLDLDRTATPRRR